MRARGTPPTHIHTESLRPCDNTEAQGHEGPLEGPLLRPPFLETRVPQGALRRPQGLLNPMRSGAHL